MSNHLAVLSRDQCVDLLCEATLGRIATVIDGYPVVFPVNCLVVRDDATVRIHLRTRIGNSIDQPFEKACFQIDGADSNAGWSVLVRGRLRAVNPAVHYDSHPLVHAGRDQWLEIVVSEITGRRLVTEQEWSFDARGYA